jgi:hypothetical protein
MPASNKLCKAVVDPPGAGGAETVFFRSNVLMYTGTFGTAVGIEPATEVEAAGKAPYSVRQLIRFGFLRRMTAYLKGTATAPGRASRILVASGKEDTARGYANGTNTIPGVKGGAVVSIREANRMRLL